MPRIFSLAALLVAGLASTAGADQAPDPLTVTHLTVAAARRLVTSQEAKPTFPAWERYDDACDMLAAIGGSPGVVAEMRQAARRAKASVRTPFAADLFAAVRDPDLMRDKALFRQFLPLPQLAQLDADVAAVLACFAGELSCDGLRSLTPQAARSLAGGLSLRLDGLESLPDETAAALLDMPDPPALLFLELSLGGLRDLTADTASRIANRTRRVRLDGLRVLEPDVARALVGRAEDRQLSAISLRGLRELPAATARELARFPGWLDLAGLRRLEPETAAALAAFGSDAARDDSFTTLDLSGLAELSPTAARALVPREGPRFRGQLDLSGLRELSVDTARALHDHPGPLVLEGLERLTPEAAAAVAGGSMPLGLRGLRELSPAVAAALARHRGPLIVAAVAPLPVPVAESLGAHAGPFLAVADLASLTPETAAALARHAEALSFPHLESLTPACAAAFASHAGALSFPSLQEVPEAVLERLAASRTRSLGVQVSRLTPRAAEALALHSGDVDVFGLRELDCPALAAKAGLDISRLTRISPAALRALSQREDRRHFLSVSGLATLSLEQAEALAGYRGSLELDGVRQLAPVVAQALAAGRPAASPEPTVGSFSLRGLEAWDPAVLQPLLATRRVDLGLRDLSTLTPQRAAALVAATGDEPLELPGIAWLDAPDAVDVARALAKKRGVLALPNLEAVSPRGLAALREAENPRLPDTRHIELIPEPDGSNDDVPLPAVRQRTF